MDKTKFLLYDGTKNTSFFPQTFFMAQVVEWKTKWVYLWSQRSSVRVYLTSVTLDYT